MELRDGFTGKGGRETEWKEVILLIDAKASFLRRKSFFGGGPSFTIFSQSSPCI